MIEFAPSGAPLHRRSARSIVGARTARSRLGLRDAVKAGTAVAGCPKERAVRS